MQKLILISLTAFSFLSIFSCQKESIDDVNEEILHSEMTELSGMEFSSPLEIDVDSLFTIYGSELETRSSRTVIYKQTVSKNAKEWVSINPGRSELNNYNFIMEVRNGSAVAHPYVYGNSNGTNWRLVKSNTTGSVKSLTLTLNDLRSNESNGFLGAYFTNKGSAKIIVYRELKTGSTGGDNSGSNTSNLTISPTAVSPSTGNISTTNFKFSVATNPKPTTTMLAQLEFISPDSKVYTFTMTPGNNGFTHARTLSQAGLYKYRYIVKHGGQTKTSNWMNLQVNGNTTNINFPATCLTSAAATCKFATSDNAFKAPLLGQCTWYAYGRVIELANSNHIPKGIASKFNTAFWGKSNRHAKNWPSFLGGTWHRTNQTALPQHLRKKGLLVVWNFGSYGHVAFVESVSADKRTYTISEFNNPEGHGFKTRTLPFEGNDKMGGGYPQFLDLTSY